MTKVRPGKSRRKATIVAKPADDGSLRGYPLMIDRMLAGENQEPDTRPKPAKLRDALALLEAVAKMDGWLGLPPEVPVWPVCSTDDNGHAYPSCPVPGAEKWRPEMVAKRNAGVMLMAVGDLFRAELGNRVASASTVAVLKRWSTRDLGDKEGRILDVLRELGALGKDPNNWTRGADVPDADALLRELIRPRDGQGFTFLAACEMRKGAKVTRKKLYARHLAWFASVGAQPQAPADFCKAVKLLPGVKARTFTKDHEKGWIGIGLKKRGTKT